MYIIYVCVCHTLVCANTFICIIKQYIMLYDMHAHPLISLARNYR